MEKPGTAREEFYAALARSERARAAWQAAWEEQLAQERAERLERERQWEEKWEEQLAREQAAREAWAARQEQAAEKNLQAAVEGRDRLARLEEKYARAVAEGKGFLANYTRAQEEEFAASLPRAMAGFGIAIAAAEVRLRVRRGPERLEYDFVAPNGEVALVGEVKARLRVKHVAEMVGRLLQFREDYPEYAGLRLHGVLAGAMVDAAAAELARAKGFFVLRLAGASAHPATAGDFTPTAY